MTFVVQCPHCRHGNEDPFEVMTRGEVDWTLCASCNVKFFYLMADCQACEEECVFTWRAAPESPQTSLLECSQCAHRLEISDAAIRPDQPRG